MPKIEMGKQYRTRDRRPVRVLCTDAPMRDGRTVVAQVGGAIYTVDADVRYIFGQEHALDLIECGPYDHIKIDALVLVRDSEKDTWKFRYFAGADENGMPTTWSGGGTSWSATGTVCWRYCELFDTNNPEHLKVEKG